MDATGLPAGLAVSQTAHGWQVGGVDQAPAGAYDAVVRVSDGKLMAETPLHLDVRRESAQVGYTGDLLFSTGSATGSTADVVLRAHVHQDPDGSAGDVTRAAVLFDVYAPGNSTGVPDATYAASPTADGDARVDIGSHEAGTWSVVVRTDPSAGDFEAPSSDAVPVTVYAPRSGTFVKGVGWVHDPASDDPGTFGLEARPRKDGSPSGVVAYAFAGADDKLYVVRSTGWQGGGLAISGNRATIAGTCEVIVLDPVGHVVTRSTGTGSGSTSPTSRGPTRSD